MKSRTILIATDLQLMQQEVGDSKSSQGTGGMQSKLRQLPLPSCQYRDLGSQWIKRRFYFECDKEYYSFL
jgi:hypothetical protein